MTKFSEIFEENTEFPVREKCQRFYLNSIKQREENTQDNKDETEEDGDEIDTNIPANLASYEKILSDEAMHGDMIIIGPKMLRSLNVFFVNCIIVEDKCSVSKFRLIRKLIQKDSSGSGCTCVPVEVTARLSNPIKFYENAFNFDNYDEVDFVGIEIDTKEHRAVIEKFTNGKTVHSTRKCFYFLSFNEWDSSSGMFLWCDFFLDDFDSGRFLKLTPEIPETFLVEHPVKIRDAQIFSSSLELKTKYEEKFTNLFLTMRKGTEVEVYGITFFCPKINEHSGGTVLTMIFNRVEMNNETNTIDKIVLNRAVLSNQDDSIQDNQLEESREEFIFRQKIFTEYGRFGNVKLWSIENVGIISADDLNSYVICNSDLFLSQL